MQQRAILVKTKKQLEEDITRIDNIIKAKMQDASRADFSDWTVTWKAQTRSTFDRKALEKDYPMIDLDSYYKTSSSRVFRVAEKKKVAADG